MTTLAVQRAAIAAAIAAVPDAGQVHDYERYAERESDFRGLYVATVAGQPQIRGWHVRRTTTREIAAALGVATEVNTWRIVGYAGIDDAAASEKTFDDLVETVRAAFRADPTLGGVFADLCDLTAAPDAAPYGLQVTGSAPVLFAGKLCHRVELALTTSILRRY